MEGMNVDNIHELLAKHFSEETSKEEEAFIEEWLKSDGESNVIYKEAKMLWDNSKKSSRAEFDSEQAFLLVSSKLQLNEESNTSSFANKRKDLSKLFKVAAVIVILLGSSIPLINEFNSPETPDEIVVSKDSFQEITSAKGEIKNLKLIDGTKIKLNGGSKVKLVKENFLNNRVVHLSGEAFFEVENVDNAPFKIFTKESEVEVLGTKFNVTSWDKLSEVKVAVLEGKVSFKSTAQNSSDQVLLTNGEMSKLSEDDKPSIPVKININEEVLYWLNNELRFYNTPLKNVLVRLESFYNVEIKVKDIEILSKHLTANFKDESLEEVMKVISIALNLRYTIENNKQIKLSMKGSNK